MAQPTPEPALSESDLQAIEARAREHYFDRVTELPYPWKAAESDVPDLVAAVRAGRREHLRLDTENALLSDDNAWIRNETARQEEVIERSRMLNSVLFERIRTLEAGRDAAEAVARVAHGYVECLAEFTDTAAGNLSNCCAEQVQFLIEAVDRWRATSVEPETDGR